jgi:hypothetical protein
VTPAVKAWRALTVFAAFAAAAALLLSAGLYVRGQDDVRERAEVIREGQIFNCHVVGDPLRDAVINGLKNQNIFAVEDIAADKAIPPEFFPSIPPAELERLLQEGAKRNRALIAENQQIIKGLRDVPPCAMRYPPLND